MPNDPNKKSCEDCGAEDDPERRLRQVSARRSLGELARDEFKIAFDQSEVGSRGSACRNVRVCSLAMPHVMAERGYSTVKPDKAPGPALRSPRNQQRDRSQMRAAPETSGDLDGVGVPQLAQERSAD